MSASDSRGGHIRSREVNEDDSTLQPDAHPNPPLVDAAMGQSPTNPSATTDQLPPSSSLCVTPLPEQFSQHKKPRRSARLACHLDKLAVVELQLVLQWLDAPSKLRAARCSRRLLQAASAPFPWRDEPPFVVEDQSPAEIQRVCSSLRRFAPIHLRCFGLESLQRAATMPCLLGLELPDAPTARTVATDLPQLLQHPNLARLQILRLHTSASVLLTVDTMRLIARLPRLRTFDLWVMSGQDADATLLQPLTTMPKLTDLTIHQLSGNTVGAAMLNAISGCVGLRKLCLHLLPLSSDRFIAFCSAPTMRQLQHLELIRCDLGLSEDEHRVAFGALDQLQSLTLEKVFCVNKLLPHLHSAPALRLLSIRCIPSPFRFDTSYSPLPNRDGMSALLTAAPQLHVRLLLPTFEHQIVLGHAVGVCREVSEYMWHELQRIATEMERVDAVVDDESPSKQFAAIS